MLSDLRYLLRRLRREWKLSTVVVATVAVGIGLGLSALSAADGLLFRPPAGVSDPALVKRVYIHHRGLPGAPFERGTQASLPDFSDLRQATSGVADVAAYFLTELPVRFPTAYDQVVTALVSDNYFRALGSRPHLGRLLDTADIAADAPGAVISHRLWRRAYGGREDVVGQRFVLNGRHFVVAGVARRHFQGLSEYSPDAWILLNEGRRVLASSGGLLARESGLLQVFARIRERGADHRLLSAARDQIARLEADHPLRYWKRQVTLGRVTDPETISTGRERIAIAAACATLGGIVLLLVSLVSANLGLASTVARQRELLTRVALGASRRRVAALVGAEVLLMTVLGSALGVALAAVSGAAVRLPASDRMPSPLDERFIVLGALCAAVSGLAASALPAYSVLRRGGVGFFRQHQGVTDRAWSQFSAALVVAGIAGSVVLVAAAGLFARSFLRASRIELGFDPKRLIVASVTVASPAGPTPDSAAGERLDLPDRSQAFFSEALERLRGMPGVASATVAAGEPYRTMTVSAVAVSRAARESESRAFVISDAIGTDYFRTLGLQVVRGRVFTRADHRSLAEDAVINEAMARDYWRNDDPVGKCLYVGSGEGERCLRIVGVVQDARIMSVREKAPNIYYVPLGPQSYQPDMTIFVRVRGDAAAGGRTVDRVLRSVRADLPKIAVRPMEELLAPQLRPWRRGTVVFGAAATLTVFVAALSLYALLSYLVTRKTPEFGVRLALGAPPAHLTRLVAARGAALVVSGVVIGTAVALIATRPLQPILYEIGHTAADVYLATGLLLAGVAAVAGYVPTRRAARTDPAVALRAE